MPVQLEHITQPSDQDWIDLGKIYAEGPQQWLADSSNIKASIQPLIDQGTWLIAGRFNSRLLGAMQAQKEGKIINLQHFCVREITRHRGVAHQMLHHMSNWANEQGYTLCVKELPQELVNSLEKRGFIATPTGYERPPAG